MVRPVSMLVALSCLCAPAAADAPPAVRAVDPIVIVALARGSARSATFRALLSRLQASDVIVHVERRAPGGRAFGFTRFVVSSPPARYLRITLHVDSADDATVGLLAHELQHAVEVADAPWVRDEASYGALYRRIGRAACGPPLWCFDTMAAVITGKQVYDEVGSRRGLPLPRLATAQQHERQGDD